jgi:hypothetical protein
MKSPPPPILNTLRITLIKGNKENFKNEDEVIFSGFQ